MNKRSYRSNVLSAILIALGVLLVACGGSSSDDSGGQSSQSFSIDPCQASGLKVAEGQTCDTNGGPSPLVRLRISDGFSEGICTGSVVLPNAIVTAAHCFLQPFVSVAVDTFAGTVVTNNVVVNPALAIAEGGPLFNDIAIVFTNEALPVGTYPLLLSRSPVVGEEVVVAGFGEVSPGGILGEFRAGNARIVAVSENHITIRFEEGESHPCRGDSGGPLLVLVDGQFAIAGVVSQSDPSVDLSTVCQRGDVTLYTNLSAPEVLNFLALQVPTAAAL